MPFDISSRSAASRQRKQVKGSQQKMRHLFLLAVSSGALIASPQLASAAFTPDTNPPNYIANGHETTQQSLVEDNVQVTTGAEFSVETETGSALVLSGNGTIAYRDANDSTLISTAAGGSGLSIGANGSILVETNGAISGAGTGIKAINTGSGAVNITAENTVSSSAGSGITVQSSGGNVTLNAGEVSGYVNGISVTSSQSGFVNLTTSGVVSGTTGSGIVISTSASSSGVELLTWDSVLGGTNGVEILHAGSGDAIIFAYGDITASNGYGLKFKSTDSISAQAEIYTGNITSTDNGIDASFNGQGDLRISAGGNISSTAGTGIRAETGSSSTDLWIDTIAVAGNENGINAAHNGWGDLRISASGHVSASNGEGIKAVTAKKSSDLVINAVGASGISYGIYTDHKGSGDLSITASDAVSASGGDGISAVTGEDSQNLVIDVVSVTGGTYGIHATHNGSGTFSITASASVSGEAQSGVFADAASTTTGTVIDVADVSGKKSGVYAVHNGQGDLSITASGTVSGEEALGVHGETTAASRNLEIDVADVSGFTLGLSVMHKGTGDVNITSTGTVSASAGRGIALNSSASTQDAVINVVNVSATATGIDALHYGQGDLSITASGTISTTGDSGILGYTTNAAQDMLIDVMNVAGNSLGIWTEHGGQGSATITIGGVVEGSSSAIKANSDQSAIVITNNGTIRNSSQSPSALAITGDAPGNIINNNQLLVGAVELASRSDLSSTVNNSGTWHVADAVNEFGEGVNTLDNQAGGTILAALEEGASTTIFNNVATTTHSGSIDLRNREAGAEQGYAGDVIIITNQGSGDFRSNGGSLHIDVDFAEGTSDRLVVDNVSVASGPTRISVYGVGAAGALSAEGINVVEVTGESADNAFVLGNSLGSGLYSYQIGRGLSEETAQNWYLRSGDEMRGEVPLTSALTVLARQTTQATLSGHNDRQRDGDNGNDSFARRNGARLVSRTITLPAQDKTARKGAWGRVFGQSTEFNANNGGGYDATLWGAQAGIDLLAKGSLDKGRTYGGVYLGYATSSGDGLRNGTRLGRLKVNATSIGAYYTRYNSNGFYWDATAQYSRISDASMKYLGDTSKTDGSGYLVSLEAGKQLNQESKYVAEVQGQLLYQKTSIDEMRLPDSTRFDVGNLSGATGRIGVRLARNPYQDASLQPWLSANLWKTFNQDVRITSLGETASTPTGGTSGEVQLGFSLVPQKSGSWSAYVSGGYQFDISGSDLSGWKGTVGVRKGW